MKQLLKKLFPVFLSMLLLFNSSAVFADYSLSSRSEQTLSVSERERSAVSVNRLHTSIPQDIYTSYCSITDSFFCADSPVTVIIQDLHNDYLVQNNIYKTIDLITKSENFSVYGEGVFGEVLDVSILKDIPDSRIKKYTINNLFKNSTLSAYEYYALVDDKEVKGLENKEVYLKNLKLYNNITENKSFNISLIDEALSKINYIKKHFAEDRIAVIQSLELSKIDFDETQFPNLAKYKSVNQKNSQINKNKLNRQFKNFVKKYGATREVHKLLKLNSRYGYAQLYDYINENLNDVAKNNKELTVFLENNKLFLEINPVKLFYEQQSLKNILLSKENLEQTEKEILLLEKFSLYLKDLANLNILPENYTELKENKSFIRELIKKYLPKNEAAFVLQVINNKDFFTFYDNNFERNKIFANVLMKDVSDKIVITGGFHKGLSEELKKNNKSYIVLTPQFSAGSSAFNDLLLNAVKEGFNEKTADKLLTILYSWRTFFKDIKSFQQEVDHWIENNKILSDNHIKITVSEESISVECNNIVYEKTFIDKGIVKTEIKVTQKQLDETVEDILNIARDVTLFGADVKVKISSDDNLLENIIPAIVRIEKDYPVIYINEKFLEVLSQNLSLTEFFVRFVYLYHSPALNADEMHKFIDDNYDTFRKLYNLKKQIEQNIAYKSRKRIRRKISEYFEKIKLFAGENVNYELPAERLKIDDGKDINDKINMNHALERVTYARKTRSFLVSFIQPPIGAYVAFDADITDKDDIETGIQTVTVVGRGINETNSLLHAESFTFVDFFKNYIDKFEKLPNGELTEKGKFLNSLLDLVLVNGQDTKNKIFLKNPIIFNNLGITNIDYSKKRDINTVFAETNAVLQFVNNELGSPLSGVTLYCTLAPCNKCVETMVALGIKKLVFGSYSANKKHKGIKRLEENRIEVEGGVLEQFCDEAIKNYRFMNASLFRTKIASAIQKIRRFLFLSKKYDRKLVKKLIEKVLDFGSYSNINIKELEYLQEHLNWNNLQEDLSLLDRLMAFLKDIDAYDDPVKRAGIMYALKNNCSFDMKDGNIYFYNSSGQKLAFYITPLGKFAASQNYFEKMKQVALARNFTDIDDHLALRGEPFNENIRRVVSILTMYGIANPIPVTGNILKVTRKRIDPLGNQIANLIPSVYIENAAIRCNIKDGEYIYDEDFIKNIAKSYVEKECLEYMREMFSDIGEEWYSLFVFFADKIKVLRNDDDLTYTKLVENVLAGYTIPDFMKDLVTEWGTLKRKEASDKLKGLYEFSAKKLLNKEEFLNIMKIMSLLEFSRLYFSKSAEDTKEAVRLKQDFEKLYNGKDLRGNFESPVRYVVSPFRPNLVRETCVLYFRPIVQAKYPDLKVESTGQTTLSIYKAGVDKGVPVRDAVNNGIPASYIISSGDELNSGGVDYPPYFMQQTLPEFKDMVVVNTNSNTFEGTFISLIKNKKFSQKETVSGNIERSLLLQQMILSIVEENVGKIAADPDYTPQNVAQELKRRLLEEDEILPPYEILEDVKDEQQFEEENVYMRELLKSA